MATANSMQPVSRKERGVPLHRYILGMAIATAFCLVYLLTPLYILAATASLIMAYPSRHWSFAIASPLLLSAVVKSRGMPGLVGMLTPLLDYFHYQEVTETSDDDLKKELEKGKKFIVACQPHGVISFVGFCAAVHASPDLRRINTAVASVVLRTPILKHVLGIFCLVDASSTSLKKHFKKKGLEGCLVLYVGGLAELFKSSRKEERLYLSARKGFIKMALREPDHDIIPAYLFGNTSVLTVVKSGPLAALSRKLQASLTYFWGRWYMPIPRDDTLLYARGKPLGLPYIPEPTDADINKWHAKYCEEVTRLFDKYKEKVPMYKHKKLFID